MAIIDCDFWTVRRKLRGACGSFCRSGPYLRRKPVSCNPTTSKQLRGRALWGYVTWAWANVLTAEERATWTELAEVGLFNDDQDQYRILVGYQWYCWSNARALLAGLSLTKDGTRLGFGYPLSSLSVALVSSTRAEFTFTPMPSPPNWGLVAYGRGPTTVGDTRLVPEAEWWRKSALPGWYWIGFGGLGVPSPVELELPFEIPTGRKLRVMCQLMYKRGEIAEDWLTDEVVA